MMCHPLPSLPNPRAEPLVTPRRTTITGRRYIEMSSFQVLKKRRLEMPRRFRRLVVGAGYMQRAERRTGWHIKLVVDAEGWIGNTCSTPRFQSFLAHLFIRSFSHVSVASPRRCTVDYLVYFLCERTTLASTVQATATPDHTQAEHTRGGGVAW